MHQLRLLLPLLSGTVAKCGLQAGVSLQTSAFSLRSSRNRSALGVCTGGNPSEASVCHLDTAFHAILAGTRAAPGRPPAVGRLRSPFWSSVRAEARRAEPLPLGSPAACPARSVSCALQTNPDAGRRQLYRSGDISNPSRREMSISFELPSLWGLPVCFSPPLGGIIVSQMEKPVPRLESNVCSGC